MKPSKTFKLSKSTKRILATMVNVDQRNAWKRAMIDAELHEAVVPKTSKKDRTGSKFETTSNAAVSVD
jgi:hypothetical protein